MPTGGTKTLVRGVRTFADDVRRAQGTADVPAAASAPANPTEAAAKPTPPVKPAASSQPEHAAPSSQTPPISSPQPEKSAATTPPHTTPQTTPQNEQPRTAPVIKPLKPIKPLEESHLSDEGKLFDIRTEAGDKQKEATIVKDTKRNNWSLTRALGDSIKEWVDDQKDTFEERAEKRNPKPRVAPSDTRTDIIRAARSRSPVAPKDDHHAVVEKLRTFARDAERVTGKKYTISTKEDTAPHWSHILDENANTSQEHITAEAQKQLEKQRSHSIKRGRKKLRPAPHKPATKPRSHAAPAAVTPAKQMYGDVAPEATGTLNDHDFTRLKEAVQPVAVPRAEKDVAREVARSTPPPPAVAPDVAPTVPHTAAPVPEETDADRAARDAAIEKLLSVARHDIEAAEQPDAPAVAETPSRDIPFEKPKTKETEHFRTYRNDAIENVQQEQKSVPVIAAAQESRRAAQTQPQQPAAALSPRPFVIAGVVIILVVLVGGIGFFFARDRDTAPGDTPIVTKTPSFITTSDTKPVPFSTNRARLLDTLTEAVSTAGGTVTYIYPTYTEDGDPVSTSDFMAVLDPRAPGSFIRNLNEQMMFGAVGSEPFFILRTEQYDTTYAGMLDWESFMSADLTPLFGAPVRATLDPRARTQHQTRAAFFVDEIIANTDARVLYDEDGDERIIYAFLDRDTVAITTTSNALRILLERYR